MYEEVFLCYLLVRSCFPSLFYGVLWRLDRGSEYYVLYFPVPFARDTLLWWRTSLKNTFFRKQLSWNKLLGTLWQWTMAIWKKIHKNISNILSNQLLYWLNQIPPKITWAVSFLLLNLPAKVHSFRTDRKSRPDSKTEYRLQSVAVSRRGQCYWYCP